MQSLAGVQSLLRTRLPLNGSIFTAYRHLLPADVQVNLLGAMYACTRPHLDRDAASQLVNTQVDG